MRTKPALMKVAFAGAFLLTAAIAAAQTTVIHRTVPISIKASKCSELSSNLTGTADQTIVIRANGITLSTHGIATTADGAQYILIHNDTFSAPVSSVPQEFTQTEKFFLIGQGGAVVHGVEILHGTINPDGSVTIDVDNEQIVGDEACLPGDFE